MAKGHKLRFKTTALYYISSFADDPPSFDGRGRPIAQTTIGSIAFGSEALRDAALAITLGKLSVLWWSATGDDFHVTGKGLAGLPIALDALSPKVVAKLAAYGAALRREMPKHVIYTQYAGKKMGNCDIEYLRRLTDEIDRYLLEVLDASDTWEDVEVAYARFMKMTKERPGTTRADLSEEAD
jgi:ssDNA-binding replication factor A large subunit